VKICAIALQRGSHCFHCCVRLPPGYQVLYRHRGISDQRGGGVALVYRDTVKATTVDVGNSIEFESLAVKLTGRRFKASVAVCVYRPPGTALH